MLFGSVVHLNHKNPYSTVIVDLFIHFFLYCFPDCPSCRANTIQTAQATWAIWAAINKDSLSAQIHSEMITCYWSFITYSASHDNRCTGTLLYRIIQ